MAHHGEISSRPSTRDWGTCWPKCAIGTVAFPFQSFYFVFLLWTPSRPNGCQQITSLALKLKDKVTRAPAMQAMCQLVWTYLARIADPPAIKLRRVEEVVRLTFPAGKKTHVSTETGISDALVQLIRIIGYAYQDLCFRSIIFPLVNLETIQSSRDPED